MRRTRRFVPFAGDLRGSAEGDEPFLLEAEFRHVPDWRQVDPGCIDRAPDGFGSALSFFSAAAFRYYQHREAEPADA